MMEMEPRKEVRISEKKREMLKKTGKIFYKTSSAILE